MDDRAAESRRQTAGASASSGTIYFARSSHHCFRDVDEPGFAGIERSVAMPLATFAPAVALLSIENVPARLASPRRWDWSVGVSGMVRSCVRRISSPKPSLPWTPPRARRSGRHHRRKVARLLGDLETYVSGHSDIIINYTTARRREEPISTAITESTVQWLLHRRMSAQQQMRWSPKGAHLLLKVRTSVVNGTLDRDHVVAECYALPPFPRAA
jgi:hypothetical protein